MEAETPARGLWQRVYALIEAGFDVMARYPFDLSELQWNRDLYEPPPDDEGPPGDEPSPPTSPGAGRPIKVVPPPASQRYQAARSTRLPSRSSRRKQPVA